jgi:hypothetical protein
VLTWVQRGNVAEDKYYGKDLFFLELAYLSPEDVARELNLLLRINLDDSADHKRQEHAKDWLCDPAVNVALVTPRGLSRVNEFFSVVYYYALKNGWVTLANWLRNMRLVDLAVDIDVFIPDNDDGDWQEARHAFRYEPFEWAIWNGRADMIRLLLLDPRIAASVDYNSIFTTFAVQGYVELINLFITDPRVDPAVNNNRAIRYAAGSGRLNVVERLLQDRRVNPNDENDSEYSAIVRASASGHVEVVARLLEDPRVIPAIEDNQAVIVASAEGHLEVVKLLLAYHNPAHPEWRVDPSSFNNWALIMAARNGHAHVVDFLLKDDRVAPTDFNHAALTQADANDQVEVVALLEAWYQERGLEVPGNVKRRRLQGRVYK